MVVDPILNEVAEISSSTYFQMHRLKFWKNYAEYMRVDINPSWFNKDSYVIPMVELDLDNGKQFTKTYEPSLSSTIRRDINSKFSRTEINIQRYLDTLNHDLNEEKFFDRIVEQLKLIFSRINYDDVSGDYQKVITDAFQENLRRIKNYSKTQDSKVEVEKSENSGIYYKFCEEEEGVIALNEFSKALAKSRLIEKTSISELKKIFSDRPAKKKVIWKGQVNEFKYFFKELEDRGVISFQDIWEAAINNFLVIKRSGGFYSNESIRGAGKLKNSSKRMKIDALLDLLEVQ